MVETTSPLTLHNTHTHVCVRTQTHRERVGINSKALRPCVSWQSSNHKSSKLNICMSLRCVVVRARVLCASFVRGGIEGSEGCSPLFFLAEET